MSDKLYKCSGPCKQMLPRTAFHNGGKAHRDGAQPSCKQCLSAYHVTGRLGVECSFYERAHRDEYNRVVLDALPSVAAQFRGCLNTPDDDSE